MSIVPILFLTALASAAFAGWESEVTVSDEGRQWQFVSVEGTSRLPLDFLRSGENGESFEYVSLPRFWIARKMVTEGDFALVMGRSVPEGRRAEATVTSVEWEEAVTFCRKFTEKYASQFPSKTLASLPMMLEWAHAARVLDGRIDLYSEAATFLYAGNAFGGYLSTSTHRPKNRAGATNETEQLAWTFSAIPKRRKVDTVGIRLVLVDRRTEMLGAHPIVSRGVVALQHGYREEARRLLRMALSEGDLTEETRKSAERAFEYAQKEDDVDLEDWCGLVVQSARFAASKGYVTEPYASAWQLTGWNEMSNRAVVVAYRKARIDGGWLPIGDLPKEIRADQMAPKSVRVQVVACDFTGDGRQDLVIERYGAVGADGYWYDFYRRQPNGAYQNIHHVQTVGLCVLPKKAGPCGFLNVSRHSNPVLSVSLLSYVDGRIVSEPVNAKPFGMLDADPSKIYRSAPFIGGSGDRGWKILEERGVWFRPIYWPWKPGVAPKR